MRIAIIAAAAAAMLGVTPLAAQPPGPDMRGDRHEMRQDRREMRQDVRQERREVRQDRREVRQDRRELRHDRRSMRHNGWTRGHHYGWRNGRGNHCRTVYRHHHRVRICR